MTGIREPQQDGRIQAMLRDAGLDGATELRGSLEQLSALVPDRAPAPRADLAAMLAAGGFVADSPDPSPTTAMPALASAPGPGEEPLPAGVTSLAGRRGRKRRLAIVGGAVVGAMTLGAGAVAASSEDFRKNVSHTVGSIFQPSGGTPDVAPRPARPSPADIPAPAVPSHAANSGTRPVANDAAAAPGSAASVPAAPGAAATPPAVGRGGILPVPPRRPVTPSVPGLPGPGEDRSLPKGQLPEPTLPGVLPTLPGQP
ncbi:hypothetical protein [Pseudarthrobacter sp. ATCC 49987]|uniref:hypothetical protein n=1 Tax=Pseudarthrobacter sp. ATCC 49987 TaxID=2698204 RepID=UPI00136B1542|nr:hypothetical protein [Pseudarthrobacter sp. ATCC 49987]